MTESLIIPLVRNSFQQFDRDTKTTRDIIYFMVSNLYHDRTFDMPDIKALNCSYSVRTTAIKKLLKYEWIEKIRDNKTTGFRVLRKCNLINWKLWDQLNSPYYEFIGDGYCLMNRYNVESQYVTNPGWMSDDKFQSVLDDIYNKVPGVIDKYKFLEHLLKFEEAYSQMLQGEILPKFLLWNFENYLEGEWPKLAAE